MSVCRLNLIACFGVFASITFGCNENPTKEHSLNSTKMSTLLPRSISAIHFMRGQSVKYSITKKDGINNFYNILANSSHVTDSNKYLDSLICDAIKLSPSDIVIYVNQDNMKNIILELDGKYFLAGTFEEIQGIISQYKD